MDDFMINRLKNLVQIDEMNESIYDDSDWKMRVLWFSALSPTSRFTHVERHGLIFTTDEVRDFYSKNGNSTDCLCSQSSILINVRTGEVLQQDLVERMLKKKHSQG